jgi:vancomycin permeability regulator SanA
MTVHEAEEKRMTNRKLRESFNNARNVADFIKERQLAWLGQLLKWT